MAKRVDETREHSFDDLARGAADVTLSRSKALKVGGTALLGRVLSLFTLPSRDAEAARRRQLKTLWAIVNSSGVLIGAKGAVESSKPSIGNYQIVFNRDVHSCAYSATLDEANSGEISVQNDDSNLRQVNVTTRNSSGTQANSPFHLIVHC